VSILPASRLLRYACILVGCLAAGAAMADDLRVESSVSPMSCLVASSRTALKYPKAPESSDTTSIVRVRMEFTGKDSPPRATIFFNSADERFAGAVLDFVAAYRLPCLAEGKTVSATQEFRFRPNEIMAVREAYERLERIASCVSGQADLPNYPWASKFGIDPEGTVFAKVTFTRAHEAPKVDIVFDGGDRRLANAALPYLSNYRYVCESGEEFPLVMSQSVHFAIEGSRRRRLRDMELVTFLRFIDKAKAPPVFFDFTSMTCPFSVGFELRQPYLPNLVHEREPSDPNRREFVEWLRAVKLDLPEAISRRLIGDTTKIDIPCLVLDLR
jgi:hypothetical protein